MTQRIVIPVGSKTAENPLICSNYVQWIRAYFPDAELIVVDGSDSEHIHTLLSDISGVLMTGGVDVNPKHYNQAPHKKIGEINNDRDAVEMDVVKYAFSQRIPILGICRGLQIVNIFCGGTLFQDIESTGRASHKRDMEAQRDGIHTVCIQPGSRLASILHTNDLTVNSSHHQSVDVVGKGLTVSAVAEDGTVEALEGQNPDHPILLVQWHPERLENQQSSQLLLGAFSKAMQ
jgi:putative glutamine amidotransferase